MKKKNTKYLFVTGGVLSGLGKGITAASIGAVLKSRGLSVNAQKFDPYLNVDAGTLNPAEHGECFVTADGAETDMDLGHYERFLDVEMTNLSIFTSGRLLLRLIEDERAGKFGGKNVQVVPHLTDTIQDAIEEASEGYDIHIVEVGGTVGDAESPAFFEAIREFAARVGSENCLYLQVVYLPFLGTSKETKTKPAQNAVRELRSLGITPDILVARSELPPNKGTKQKLSSMCGVDEKGIVLLPNASSIYEVPLTIEESSIDEFIVERFGIKSKHANLKQWKKLVDRATKNYEQNLRVGVIAKYMDNEDTYYSVFESLRSAARKNEVNVEIVWVDAEKLSNKNTKTKLRNMDGVLVPGGFGERGVEGKVAAARYAIENNVPYIGLCLGMQVGVIAFARLHGLQDANSTEMNPNTPYPVIDIMEGQQGKESTGGTMRLGNYECVLHKDSVSKSLYGKKSIFERHRHRYEFNNVYREQLESKGMLVAGESPDGGLVELIEIQEHPFFVASQYHPEFKSRPHRPHPMFDGFIASLKTNGN